MKSKIWRLTFFEKYFTIEKLWDGLPVFQKHEVQMHLKGSVDFASSRIIYENVGYDNTLIGS